MEQCRTDEITQSLESLLSLHCFQLPFWGMLSRNELTLSLLTAIFVVC